MKISEILREAEKLPATQGTPARNANGDPCMTWSDEAACFCAIGAISRASKDEEHFPTGAVHVGNRAARSLGFGSLVEISDGFPSLMPQVWRKAIQMAEEEEAAAC